MNDQHKESMQFEKYRFTELDKREKRLGVVCDGAAWHNFLRDIRKHGGVLEAIGIQLRRGGQKHNVSNQFTVLECWYNVACLYPIKGRLDHNDNCSPDTFVEMVDQLALDG